MEKTIRIRCDSCQSLTIEDSHGRHKMPCPMIMGEGNIAYSEKDQYGQPGECGLEDGISCGCGG